MKKLKLVVFGTGAVGGSVGGWVFPHHAETYFLDQGETAWTLHTEGLTLYAGDAPQSRQTLKVQVISTLAELNATADIHDHAAETIIVIAVKNYSLEKVAKSIFDQVGDKATIVALQNGVENQRILPKYFSKIIYGVVSYNAWQDRPGVVGYQKKGPLVLGVLDLNLEQRAKEVAALLNQGVETVYTPHLQDAAHSKMVINLTNSLTTLIGLQFRPISDRKLFQKLLTNLTFEGVRILKAAGYHECRLGGMPSWLTITAAAKLPPILTRPIFEKNVKKMVMSSMAQDILQRGGSECELESLNGYFVRLADEYGLKVPYNRAIYDLCRERFGQPGFKPLDVTEVWHHVRHH